MIHLTEEIRELVRENPRVIRVPNKLKEITAKNGYTLAAITVMFIVTWIFIFASAVYVATRR